MARRFEGLGLRRVGHGCRPRFFVLFFLAGGCICQHLGQCLPRLSRNRSHFLFAARKPLPTWLRPECGEPLSAFDPRRETVKTRSAGGTGETQAEDWNRLSQTSISKEQEEVLEGLTQQESLHLVTTFQLLSFCLTRSAVWDPCSAHENKQGMAHYSSRGTD